MCSTLAGFPGRLLDLTAAGALPAEQGRAAATL